MKKIITILIFTGITTNVFGMEYFKSLFQSKQVVPIQSTQTEATQHTKATVEVISLIDPINFQEASLNLIAAAKNNQIAGIIIIIQSGGGATSSFSVLHDLIKKISTIKPVVALVAGVACSCGYMIASAADYIFAHSFSELGSIGVMIELQKWKDTRIKVNVDAKMDPELFTAGKFKAIFNVYKTLSEEDRAYIQKIIEVEYQQFITLVAENRNLNRNEHEQWAEAKIFTAPEALELGLIDKIGTIFDAEAKILELIQQRNPDYLFANEIVTNLFPACA